MTRRNDIAIIGVGGVFPDAADAHAFWNNILAGHVAIREVTDERWEPELYFSEDRTTPDKTYSKIGGFIGSPPFDRKTFRIAPKVVEQMDDVQKLALTAVHQALQDANLEASPGSGQGRPFNREETAVILGNSMGGKIEDKTNFRVFFPKAEKALKESAGFQALSPTEQTKLLEEFETSYKAWTPQITEDSMPGELSNCIAGRVANALDLCGPNFTTDAACAASMAALSAAVQGLRQGAYDMAIAGGFDLTMDAPSYVKFSKIGALSAEHSRPFDASANGFVMGEGGGVLVLKRLEDAERDGDRIYAKVLGVGAASDGRGKGLTAPNPRGQRLSLERAYKDADVSIQSIGLFEAHGTSTKVGDAVELGVLTELLEESGGAPQEVPIGSVKSMIGHLKSAAGAASLIKTTLALYTKRLPPSAGYEVPTDGSPLHKGYLKVNSNERAWQPREVASPRRAGVSAFGFGGTNFHAVLEEYEPSQADMLPLPDAAVLRENNAAIHNRPMQGALETESTMKNHAEAVLSIFQEATGYERDELEPGLEMESELGIDTVKQAEILAQIRTHFGMPEDQSFNLAELSTIGAVIALVERSVGTSAAAEAPSLETTEPNRATAAASTDKPLLIRVAGVDRDAIAQAIRSALGSSEPARALTSLHETTRGPIRLAFVAKLDEVDSRVDDAMTKSPRRLAAQGTFWGEGDEPQKVAFLFPGQGSQYVGMLEDLASESSAVEAVFARGERALKPLINGSLKEIVWGDREDPTTAKRLRQTEICQPAMLTADIAMMQWLNEYGLKPAWVVGHSLGEYAACVAAGVMDFEDALHAVSARGKEMAAVDVPDCGKMATVAAGVNLVEEHLQNIDGYVVAANQNCHSQTVIAGATAAVEQAVAYFQEKGIDSREIPVSHAFHSEIVAPAAVPLKKVLDNLNLRKATLPICSNVGAIDYPETASEISSLLAKQMASPVEFIRQIEKLYAEGVRIFVEVGPKRAITGFVKNILDKKEHTAIHTNHPKRTDLESAMEALASVYAAGGMLEASPTKLAVDRDRAQTVSVHQNQTGLSEVSGLAVLMPKPATVEPVDADWFSAVARGDNFIESVSNERLGKVVDKKIERLEKSSGRFSAINTLDDVFKLAGQTGDFDIADVYGVDEAMAGVLDRTSQLAIAAGIDAMRDAGLPLVERFRETKTGRKLANGWALPEAVGRETGVIFASAFPGVDRLIEEVSQASRVEALRDLIGILEERGQTELRDQLKSQLSETGLDGDYQFSRKFLFRILSMGHTQMAQHLGALGPNTQLNAACASGSQAISIATDWIAAGRCKRVLVISADDVTYRGNLEWIGSGFLASGAATTLGVVEDAAVPFGKTRNGMILGSGAAAFVVEAGGQCEARGLEPISRIITTHIGNSAFHATRLEPVTIRQAFKKVAEQLSRYSGLSTPELAGELVFMSHETYTPARGGSSAAEVDALRHAFGDAATNVLIANTKGFTGHPMGATLEDAVLMKALQRGHCPPVANLVEVDPAFADLNISRGGAMTRRFGIRFAAGFGSQMVLVAYEQVAKTEERLRDESRFDAWAQEVSGLQNVGFKLENRTLKTVLRVDGEPLSQLGVPALRAQSLSAAPSGREIETVSPIAIESKPSLVSREAILADVIERVAVATGYETDELEPALELEAELGIDTVKQAEILGELREVYGLAEDVSFELSALKTLNDIADMLTSNSGDAPVEAGLAETPLSAVGDQGQDLGSILTHITTMVADATGYTVEELEPQLELEAELGIDTVKQAELLVAIREAFGIGEGVEVVLSELNTLENLATFVLRETTASDGLISTKSVSSSEAKKPQLENEIQAAPQPSVSSGQNILEEIQAMVADATGYTVDELEPELELESELGIDTVKQAELLGAMKEAFGIPDGVEQDLASLSTLEKLAAWVGEHARTMTSVVDMQVDEPSAAQSRDDLLKVVTEVLAHETGYEVSELDPTLMLEADLGIDTVKQAEVMGILREKFELSQDETLDLSELSTIEKITAYIASRLGNNPLPPEPRNTDFGNFHPQQVTNFALAPASAIAPSLLSKRVLMVGGANPSISRIQKVIEEFGAAVEVYPSDGSATSKFVGAHSVLIVVEPHHISLQRTFEWLTEHATALQESAVANLGFIVVLPREHLTGHSVIEAGIQAMAKSLAKEWPQFNVRCISIQPDERVGAGLRESLSWMWSDAQGVTYGLGKLGVTRRGVKGRLDTLRPKLRPDTVLATGGTSGVTFEIVSALASKVSVKKLIVVGRTSPCSPETSELAGLDTPGRKNLAKQRLEQSGQRATPVEVKRWIEREARRVEIFERLAKLERLGPEVEFVNCDVSKASELAALIEEIQRGGNSVDLLIHGAGVEISKPTAAKGLADWRLTLDAKVHAAETLLSTLKPTRAMLMGSVAGRFGNAMQTDYAAANAMLAALAEEYDNTICVDWTAWAGAGMATRGSTSAVLEKAGVEFLPLELGATIGADLALSAQVGEVLVAGELGRFEDVDPVVPVEATSSVDRARPEPWSFEVDPSRSLGLRDHAIEGTPVLPGVVGIEWMLRYAEGILGAEVGEVQDVKFQAPVKFFAMEPLMLHVEVEEQNETSATISLSSSRKLKSGRLQTKKHFSLRAERERTGLKSKRPLLGAVEYSIESSETYRRYFHGESFQVLGSTLAGRTGVLEATLNRCPSWFEQTELRVQRSDAQAHEAMFQLAGLAEMISSQTMGLPSEIRSLTVTPNVEIVRVVCEPSALGSGWDLFGLDTQGEIVAQMLGYATATLRPLTTEEYFVANLETVAIERQEVTKVVESALKHFGLRENPALSEDERNVFDTLKTEKRRHEWFAGRLVTKTMLQAHFGKAGHQFKLEDITLLPDTLGRPRVAVHGTIRSDVAVSISHSAGWVVVVVDGELESVGVDIEEVSERHPSWSRQFFTETERRAAASWAGGEAEYLTSAWAVKEAYMKAIGTGARFDFRELEVQREGETWRLALKGEAKRWAGAFASRCPEVSVERRPEWVEAIVRFKEAEERANCKA